MLLTVMNALLNSVLLHPACFWLLKIRKPGEKEGDLAEDIRSATLLEEWPRKRAVDLGTPDTTGSKFLVPRERCVCFALTHYHSANRSPEGPV